jgi:drug/metabolite transporter (DMT)-like permease
VILAVAAISSSAPLIAFAAAPALAVAFWRNTIAVGLLSPVTLVRRRTELRALTRGAGRREGWYCVLSGVALAAHFATWMPSAQLTSVAAATALVATQPVWQGLIALGQGRRLPTVAWVGIGVAVVGAALATGADLGHSHRAVMGDLLALIGGMAVAVYTAFGERARRTISTTTYTTICYGVCAALLLVVCLVGNVQLTGFAGSTWLAVLGLVLGAQLLGHSMFNYALHRFSATTISVLILLEAPGAALIAWVWLRQVPRLAALPGLALLLVGVAIVVLGSARAGRRIRPVPAPPDAGPLPT